MNRDVEIPWPKHIRIDRQSVTVVARVTHDRKTDFPHVADALIRTAFALALLSAGNNSAARMAMMAITTSSSIKVNPARRPPHSGSGSVTALGKAGAESERGSVTRRGVARDSSFRTVSTRSLRITMLRLTEPRS